MEAQKIYTVEEFEVFIALPENADRRFELVDGELVEKMPTQLHGWIVILLVEVLLPYLRENPIGRILAEAAYRIPGDGHNNHVPDLSFITNDKLPIVRKSAAPYMPDLAVEVKSPDQTEKQMVDKAAYYLANGSRMVWLVYPEKRLLEVLTLTDRQLLTEADTLDGGDVLPGFSLAVKVLFEE